MSYSTDYLVQFSGGSAGFILPVLCHAAGRHYSQAAGVQARGRRLFHYWMPSGEARKAKLAAAIKIIKIVFIPAAPLSSPVRAAVTLAHTTYNTCTFALYSNALLLTRRNIKPDKNALLQCSHYWTRSPVAVSQNSRSTADRRGRGRDGSALSFSITSDGVRHISHGGRPDQIKSVASSESAPT